MIDREDICAIGSFRKTHALKGELNAVFDIFADFLDADDCLILEMDGIFVPFFIESIRPKGNMSSLIKLCNVESEEAARRFVNKDIYIRKDSLPEEFDSDEEGAYAEDFIGYKVVDINIGYLGDIIGIDDSTDNYLFEVSNNDKTILIPVAQEFIREISDENKILEMELPEGLINLNS
jgi:16S rRNA processing protein RimM